jgi:putative radical SAM enzyme (TIGR03279 family)
MVKDDEGYPVPLMLLLPTKPEDKSPASGENPNKLWQRQRKTADILWMDQGSGTHLLWERWMFCIPPLFLYFSKTGGQTVGVLISGVEPGSPAARAGILPGQTLERIDGQEIQDVLDYRFYMTNPAPTLELTDPQGVPHRLTVKKGEYEDLGLIFDTYLMDKQRSCKNRCVFCFIDQLPKGLRHSLYFKDDDARMSFLFGNYVTLTNLTEREIDRILKMHISPVNISVHTTDPDLRVKMMGNPRAGEVLRWLPRLAQGGIRLNTQLVLCPGLNDGQALEKSLSDLTALAPQMQSIAVVPVGLTAYREGLAPLRPFTKQEAGAVINLVDSFGNRMEQLHGERICYAADEFYLLAGREIPKADFYGAFDQLENGVGLWSLLRDEFYKALEDRPSHPVSRRVALATGVAAFPLLQELTGAACERFPGLAVQVEAVENQFFGPRIQVAGLVTGRDLLCTMQEKQQPGTEVLLIPQVMLRYEGDLFLDDVSLPQVEETLGVPVLSVPNSGEALLDALLGE